MHWKVICDFDGTVALQDTTDLILSAYADPEWETIEQDWKQGKIGSAECMQRQIRLVCSNLHELDALLDSVEIDPYFKDFALFCEKHGIPLTIASDGVDYFIERVLTRHQLSHLPIRANCLIFLGEDRYDLGFPHRAGDCASQSGHCKCKMAGSDTVRTLLVGDGKSDFCLAHQVDLVFAKKSLLDYCHRQQLQHAAFDHFGEAQAMLAALLEMPARQPLPVIAA